MSKPESRPEELEPPWAIYPSIAYGSIGWRMGTGEEYWRAWRAYAASRLADFPSALAYLQRHPRAPRTWCFFLASWLAPLASANPRGKLVFERATVDELGLLGDDVAYETFVRNAHRQGGVTAPWTWPRPAASPAEAWRYLTRELGWWARWLGAGCADRAAWLDAQPAAPAPWAALASALGGRLDEPLWAEVHGGAAQLIRWIVAHGALPPPWIGGHAPRTQVTFGDDVADDVDRWTWWVLETFDDAATWRRYLDRWPPPSSWDLALARPPFGALARTYR